MDVWINGLLIGGLYATTALGLSLVFGTMRMVNLAHGEFIIIGAYLAALMLGTSGLDPLLVAIPVALAVGVLAFPMQRYVFTPIMARSAEAPVTATFGLSVLLSSALVIAFGADPRTLPAPYATAQFEVLGVGVRVSLLIATIVAIVLVVALHVVLTRTRFGRQVQAASIDAEAASLVGVNVRTTHAWVFAIAAATAAIAGILIASTYSVAPNAGTGWLLRAFTVVVIGGLGSVWGVLAGAVIVAVVETVGAAVVGAQYRDVIVFGVLVLILLIRPQGLFSRKVARA